MSADLPDARWSSSLEMARVLSTYMDDPNAVRTRILEDFDKAPAHCTIQKLRAAHLAGAKRAPQAPSKPCDAYWPSQAVESAAAANDRFLRALRREREESDARALRSQFLTQPKLVAARFDKEAEAAWRQNGELAG